MNSETITVLGTGYVGLVTAVGLARLGHSVTAADKDYKRIRRLKKGESPIYEPDLEPLLKRALGSGRLRFTSRVTESVEAGSLIFVAVGTPPRTDGGADLAQLNAVIDDIAECADHDKLVVIKSTVPPGTTEDVNRRFRNAGAGARAVFVPEFLREGSALRDFLHPERLIFGAESQEQVRRLRAVFHPLLKAGTPWLASSPVTAELIKYGSNAFLATKLTFVNQLAELSESLGGDISLISRGMGLDSRIGSSFLNPGPGYGGSCFPKDTRALSAVGRERGVTMGILDAVIGGNTEQQERVIAKLEALCGPLDGRTICLWGVTFKAGTDDVRESPAIRITRSLVERGVMVRACDPMGAENFAAQTGLPVSFFSDPLEAAQGALAVVILTGWEIFKTVSLHELRRRMTGRAILDTRNLLDADSCAERGFYYQATGMGLRRPVRKTRKRRPGMRMLPAALEI